MVNFGAFLGWKVSDKLGIFQTTHLRVYGSIISRFGLFIYAGIVPFLLVWRQASYRKEFLSLFSEAKSRIRGASPRLGRGTADNTMVTTVLK